MTNLAAKIEIIHETTDDVNIQIALIRILPDGCSTKYAVRIKDLDADEVVTITRYPSIDSALVAYADTVNKAAKGPGYAVIGAR